MPAGDPDRGFQQLVQEQMPIRRKQLYETYGPGGPNPLIPGAPPSLCVRVCVCVCVLTGCCPRDTRRGWRGAGRDGSAWQHNDPASAPLCKYMRFSPCSLSPRRRADAQAGSFQLAFGRLEPGASGFVEIRVRGRRGGGA